MSKLWINEKETSKWAFEYCLKIEDSNKIRKFITADFSVPIYERSDDGFLFMYISLYVISPKDIEDYSSIQEFAKTINNKYSFTK